MSIQAEISELEKEANKKERQFIQLENLMEIWQDRLDDDESGARSYTVPDDEYTKAVLDKSGPSIAKARDKMEHEAEKVDARLEEETWLSDEERAVLRRERRVWGVRYEGLESRYDGLDGEHTEREILQLELSLLEKGRVVLEEEILILRDKIELREADSA